MNLPTVAGADLPLLAWQHTEPFDPARIATVTDVSFKPSGGLWTSPVRYLDDRIVGTGWTEWCTGEEFGKPTAPLTLITADPAAVVYVVDTVDDLVALEAACRRATPRIPGVTMWPEIAWDRLADLVDAVWLTSEGQWRTRFSTPSLYGWDCETVFWLRPMFTVGDRITLGAETSEETMR